MKLYVLVKVNWKLVKQIKVKGKFRNRILHDYLTKLESICEFPTRKMSDGMDKWQIGLATYNLLVR